MHFGGRGLSTVVAKKRLLWGGECIVQRKVCDKRESEHVQESERILFCASNPLFFSGTMDIRSAVLQQVIKTGLTVEVELAK